MDMRTVTEFDEKVVVNVRLAQSKEDGLAIKDLLQEAEWGMDELPINWEDIYPYWLICTANEVAVGCAQVRVSKPLGSLEFMAAHKLLSHKSRALVMKSLFYAGCSTLRKHGAVATSGVVLFDDKSWKKVLKKRGAVVIGSGNVMVKKLI